MDLREYISLQDVAALFSNESETISYSKYDILRLVLSSRLPLHLQIFGSVPAFLYESIPRDSVECDFYLRKLADTEMVITSQDNAVGKASDNGESSERTQAVSKFDDIINRKDFLDSYFGIPMDERSFELMGRFKPDSAKVKEWKNLDRQVFINNCSGHWVVNDVANSKEIWVTGNCDERCDDTDEAERISGYWKVVLTAGAIRELEEELWLELNKTPTICRGDLSSGLFLSQPDNKLARVAEKISLEDMTGARVNQYLGVTSFPANADKCIAVRDLQLLRQSVVKEAEKANHRQLHPKEKNSYIAFIAGLLHREGTDPRTKGLAEGFIESVQGAGFSISNSTVTKILKEVSDAPQFPK